MARNIRPPTNRGGERVRERWEEEVSKKLDNTDFSLDDVTKILFLANRTTTGQQDALDNQQNLAFVFRQFVSKIEEQNRIIRQLESKSINQSAKIEEINRKLRELEILAYGC